jgi:hypothetical protein
MGMMCFPVTFIPYRTFCHSQTTITNTQSATGHGIGDQVHVYVHWRVASAG